MYTDGLCPNGRDVEEEELKRRAIHAKVKLVSLVDAPASAVSIGNFVRL